MDMWITTHYGGRLCFCIAFLLLCIFIIPVCILWMLFSRRYWQCLHISMGIRLMYIQWIQKANKWISNASILSSVFLLFSSILFEVLPRLLDFVGVFGYKVEGLHDLVSQPDSLRLRVAIWLAVARWMVAPIIWDYLPTLIRALTDSSLHPQIFSKTLR